MYFKTLGLKGYFYYLLAKLSGSTIFFKLKKPDCRHAFFLRIPSSDIPTYKQVFIKKDYAFKVEKNPGIIVDAGANIGLASIYFANKYPDAKIIALEPEQSNFELMKKNIAPYPNIIPVHAALWHQNEEIHLIDPGLGKWGFMTEIKHPVEKLPGEVCHPVMAVTIDKLMQDYSLTQIDILKIDIEGAEKEVFSDTSSWIKKINTIIIELHERMKPGCNRCFYCGSNGFDHEWQQGENIYLSRDPFHKTH